MRMGLSLGFGAQRAGGPTVPATFGEAQWTLTDTPSASGDRLTINILSLPGSGNSPITALQYRIDGGSAITLSGTGTGAREITVTAETVTNVQISAANVLGSAPWSDTKFATPTAFTAPLQFSEEQWSVNNDATGGDITITITGLPENGGSAITALEYRVDAGSWVSLGGTTTGSYGVSGLTDTVQVSITVRAVNAIGNGAASTGKNVTPTAAPGTVPATITSGQWTLADFPSAGGDQLTVNLITAPTNGGSPITSYEFRRNGAAWSTLPGGTALGERQITVLATTLADIELRAVNANGNAAASDTKSATPTVTSMSRAILEQQIIDAHNADADTSFEGWTSETGFTVYTETTPDAVRARIETWRLAPSGKIKIICDWDGVLNLTSASFRGPGTSALTADASQLGGYARPAGGVWLEAASGKLPVFGNQTIDIIGMVRIFFDGIGFAGLRGAGTTNTLNVWIRSNGTFPTYAMAAFKNCYFGLGRLRPSEPNSQYIKAIVAANSYVLHIEDCEFYGVLDAVQGVTQYLRAKGNHIHKNVSDAFTQFGFSSAWAGRRVYAWVERNVVCDVLDDAAYSGQHTDFYQYGGGTDAHAGSSMLVRNNMAHMKTTLANDSGSQGVFGDNNATENYLVAYNNIFAFTAYNGVVAHDLTGLGHFYMEDNLLMRAGDWYLRLNAPIQEVFPVVKINAYPSPTRGPGLNGGIVSVNNNYLTSITNVYSLSFTGTNFFIDPRRSVAGGGTGASLALAKRPENEFSGTFTRDGSDTLLYTIPGEATEDYATAFYAIADFFEPQAGWGVNAGPDDPSTWPNAPTRPSTDITAPTILSTIPADNATGVSVTVSPSIMFNESVVFGTGLITLRENNGGWADLETFDVATEVGTGNGQVSIADAVLTINPTASLTSGREYAIRIAATAIDDVAGNSFAGVTDDTTISFTAADVVAPTISSTSPTDNATGVSVVGNLTATFSEPVVFGTGLITLRQNISGTWSDVETFDVVTEVGTGNGQVSISGAVLTINPTASLTASREYAIRIASTAIDDTSGNSFAGIADDTTWSFTAAAGGIFTTGASGPAFFDQTGTTFSGNNGKFTFKAVLKVPATTSTQTIAVATSGSQFHLEILNTNNLRVNLRDSLGATLMTNVATGAVIVDGTTHTIVVAADLPNQTFNIWVDGSNVMSQALAANSGVFSTPDIRYLSTVAVTQRLVGDITSLTWWQNVATTDGTDPAPAPYKVITGPAATANADSWRVAGDADAT